MGACQLSDPACKIISRQVTRLGRIYESAYIGRYCFPSLFPDVVERQAELAMPNYNWNFHLQFPPATAGAQAPVDGHATWGTSDSPSEHIWAWGPPADIARHGSTDVDASLSALDTWNIPQFDSHIPR